MEDALWDIESQEGEDGPPISVLALGRYRGSREAFPPPHRGRLGVEFSTVHAAKGREADYVIVLDLRDARHGFASQLEDDPPSTSCCLRPREAHTRTPRSGGSSTSR